MKMKRTYVPQPTATTYFQRMERLREVATTYIRESTLRFERVETGKNRVRVFLKGERMEFVGEAT